MSTLFETRKAFIEKAHEELLREKMKSFSVPTAYTAGLKILC